MKDDVSYHIFIYATFFLPLSCERRIVIFMQSFIRFQGMDQEIQM